jgi:hypothetical protein
MNWPKIMICVGMLCFAAALFPLFQYWNVVLEHPYLTSTEIWLSDGYLPWEAAGFAFLGMVFVRSGMDFDDEE